MHLFISSPPPRDLIISLKNLQFHLREVQVEFFFNNDGKDKNLSTIHDVSLSANGKDFVNCNCSSCSYVPEQARVFFVLIWCFFFFLNGVFSCIYEQVSFRKKNRTVLTTVAINCIFRIPVSYISPLMIPGDKKKGYRQFFFLNYQIIYKF